MYEPVYETVDIESDGTFTSQHVPSFFNSWTINNRAEILEDDDVDGRKRVSVISDVLYNVDTNKWNVNVDDAAGKKIMFTYFVKIDMNKVLNEGLIDIPDSIASNNTYRVYAMYNEEDPLLDIIDPVSDKILVHALSGSLKDESGAYEFEVEVPEIGDDGYSEGSKWTVGGAVCKLYSEKSTNIFRKYVNIVKDHCTDADICESITQIKATEREQSRDIMTMKNGVRVRIVT